MRYAKLKLAIGMTAGIILADGAMTSAISQSSGAGNASMASTNTSSPLHFDPGPTGGEAAVRDFLNKYAGQPTFGSHDADSLTIQPPMPMYRLPAKNMVITAGLGAAKRDGYLLSRSAR